MTARKLVFGLTLGWMTMSMASVSVFAQLNDGVPKEAAGVGVEQKLGAQVPGDLGFVDDQGRKVFLGQYFDGKRPVLLSLNYSDCPMLCSVQLNQLVLGLQNVELDPGADFQILSVSISPKDTWQKAAETKRKYSEQLTRPGIDQAWHFLTGDYDTIKKLADSVGFQYRFDQKSGEYYHPAMLAFLSPSRIVSSYQLAVDYPASQLKLGLLDAAGGKIGSFVDALPLLCFVYDEKRGSFVMSAYKIMRIGGASTVVVLLIALIPYWRGVRKPNSPGDDGSKGITELPPAPTALG